MLEQLENEIDILQVEKLIRGRVKKQMEKSQRDYYLNEQVKAIQRELGEGDEGAELEELEERVKNAKLPTDARKKAESERSEERRVGKRRRRVSCEETASSQNYVR